MEIKGLSLSDELRMLKGAEPITPPTQSTEKKPSFMEFLKENLKDMNQMGLDIDHRIQEAAEGKTTNPHETYIAIQKADVSFKLMMTVKDQLEQAYQQIMRTAIG